MPRFSALRMVESPKSMITLARALWIGFFISIFALFLAPWQQTAFGVGRVIAYTPVERQQVIEAPIKGRITRWYVTEGSTLKKGDLIAEIADNDPQLFSRIQEERQAFEARLRNAQDRIKSYKSKVRALEDSKRLALQAAQLKIQMAQQKIRAAKQKLSAGKAALRAATLNLRRIKSLKKDDLVSQRSLELAELTYAKRETEVNMSAADLTSARANEFAMRAERLKIGAEAQAKIDSAQADLQKAEEEASKGRADVAKVSVKVARQRAQVIRAPRDCIVLSLLVNEQAEMLKEGKPIARIVPATSSRAVELWVDGNDAPLITRGRHVRLQFEGWPAVQFTGWPSVAVGTFGGTVSLVDATDNGDGKFRILIIPDKKDEAWPEGRFLRQGVRAKGWTFLNRVSLAFELWRQFNGFPPTIDPKNLKKPVKTKKIKK
ncbi:MAG: HlyD family efflux transporter periplasmic adaptor subunit [Myxococcales bacterium]|nr:HlyD family efflux transporter periplasmic adaptor subunit [Myxococcales bacterium]